MQNLWKGKKVSEKVFGRVLISSVCGIFLCMACLVSATWAWYVVGIENPDNTIQITTAKANVTIDNGAIAAGEDGTYVLPVGEHSLEVDVDNETASVYVVMSVGGNEKCYFAFISGENTPATMQITVYEQATVSFISQWTLPEVAPAGATLTIGEAPAGTDGQEDVPQQPGEEENTNDDENAGEAGQEGQTNENPETDGAPDVEATPVEDTPVSGDDTQAGT